MGTLPFERLPVHVRTDVELAVSQTIVFLTLSLINRYKFSLDFRFGIVANPQKWTIPFYAMPCLIALFIASFARFSAFHWY